VNLHRASHLKLNDHLSSAVDDVGQEDDVRVYPISSDGGYVMYHVGSTLSNQPLQDFQSFEALMSGTVHRPHDGMMTENCVDSSSLDFPIDAFGSHASLDTHVTSHGKTTVPFMSAFSNVRQHSYDETSVETHINGDDSGHHVHRSAESIVDKVISEIIDAAVTRCVSTDIVDKPGGSRCDLSHGPNHHLSNLSNGLDGEDDAQSEMFSDGVDCQSDLSSAAAQTSAGNLSPTVHPLYAHILLYVRKFDTNRAMYALGRLRAILATSANVIVRALTTSNVGGANTPRAVLLQSLLVQHRRSLLGRRFCGDDTESSASGIRSSMFIDVLVTICLYYVRGYYPNFLAPSLTALDIADNARLQVSAADILTTVLDELAVITRTGGRGFATYIFDLLDKCKVR